MASPSAMAKCLRADAKVMAGSDAAYGQAENGARILLSIVKMRDEDIGIPTLHTKLTLMLAAAAALEAEDE
jgi:hypothetical protein